MSRTDRTRTLAAGVRLEGMDPSPPFRIGTAGWSISRAAAATFAHEGTGLERYSAVFSCAEINSSFHRPHRASTWEKWRDSVPEGFRFSVKLPKTVTHEARLANAEDALATFVAEASLLKEKLAVLLVQLPPSLALDAGVAARFLYDLKRRTPARVAVEPRHASWFSTMGDELLAECGAARVGADPARVPEAARPLVVEGLAYWRLHGSPVIYRSSYADRIGTLAAQIAATDAEERWCIFDNTASSAAIGDALCLEEALAPTCPRTPAG